jgi:SAM-dependent methyltransferase/acyl carrier protein
MDPRRRVRELSPAKLDLLAQRLQVHTGIDRTLHDRLVAYVVPERAWMGGRKPEHAEDHAQVGQWLALYDEVYAESSPEADPTFNTVGWKSSYTGEPIPSEEMGEQVERTVERILQLRPRRVLEIGCGTGMLMFRIAPHCTRYLATDFSQGALDYLRRQLASRPLPQVELSRCTADDLPYVEEGGFDTVILNSVVQYFPSVGYLLGVLEAAVRAVSPQGHIFVGDVRSLPLLEAFHASVELFRAPPSQPLPGLCEQVRRRVIQEKELVIDPAFFPALALHLPQIRQVEVQPKRGRHHNELTRFRYDVVLQLGGEPPLPAPARWLSWEEVGSVDALRRLLAQHPSQALAVREVPSARLQAEMRVLRLLEGPGSPATAGEVQEDLQRLPGQGVNPEELWGLGEELPYEVHLRPSTSQGCYDAVFRPRLRPGPPAVEGWQPPARRSPWGAYANDPLQGKLTQKLVPALRALLQERLPEYMIPSAFMILEALPLTPNGKVDRAALPAPDQYRPEAGDAHVPPRTEMEEALAEIWKEVLSIKSAEVLGVHDNFFNLGGHSLLAVQVASRLRRLFGVELPVSRLFEAPTLAELAEVVEREALLTKGGEQAKASMLDLVERLSDAEAKVLLAEREDPRREAGAHR